MSNPGDELAFENYLKKCKELHEEKHPEIWYDNEAFRNFATEKWNTASEIEKGNFRHSLEQSNSQDNQSLTLFRCQTPFAIFSNEKRKEIMRENPEVKVKILTMKLKLISYV